MAARRKAFAVVVVAALAGLVMWWQQARTTNGASTAVDEREAAASTNRVGGLSRPRPTESGQGWPQLNRNLAFAADARKRGTRKVGSRLRFAMLFADDCMFGVDGHCKEWSALSVKCDSGDVGACTELGNLLIVQSPQQPLWGSYALDRACDLGADSAICARAEQWGEWSRFGYDPRPWKGDAPAGIAEGCDGGNQVACGLIQMRHDRAHQPVDEPAALASCRAGFRDACAAVVVATTNPRTLRDALKVGCDLPDAWMCWHLANYLTRCEEGARACLDPDPERAAHFRTLACALAPQMRQCKSL